MGEVVEQRDLEPFPLVKIGMVYREMFNEIREPHKEREDRGPPLVDLRCPPGGFEDDERFAGHSTSMAGERNVIIGKNALEKSSDSNYDALLGSAPAAVASPGCDCTVLPVHYRGEIFRPGNAGLNCSGILILKIEN